jgi:hypothetical protein
MQSVHRAFEDYLNVVIERDKDVNNIILGQACRHVMAHRGAVVDERLMRQVKEAKPRVIKSELEEGQVIRFDNEEIGDSQSEHVRYVGRLCKKLESQLTVGNTGSALGRRQQGQYSEEITFLISYLSAQLRRIRLADVKAWPPQVVSKNTRNFCVSRMTKGRLNVRVYFVPVRTAPHFRRVS